MSDRAKESPIQFDGREIFLPDPPNFPKASVDPITSGKAYHDIAQKEDVKASDIDFRKISDEGLEYIANTAAIYSSYVKEGKDWSPTADALAAVAQFVKS